MMRVGRRLGWLGLAGLVACRADPSMQAPPVDTSPPDPVVEEVVGTTNVLLVLLDDLGIDKVRAYHPDAPNLPLQPTLDRLSTEGVRFVHAWAQPVCSPTRAALMTGRHARRHGIGRYIPLNSDIELSPSEITLAEVLRDAQPPFATGALGKWHLSTPTSPSGLSHPNQEGFDHYAGWIGNIGPDYSFERIRHVVDGVELEPREGYATTDTIDDALDFIATAPEPWFTYVATHAVHTPLHLPPADLVDHGLDPEEATDAEVYGAMVQATDAELGRLLDSIDPEVLARTHVVVLGDNGTLGAVMVDPFDPGRDKGTLYEGGVRVPLWVLGPAVVDPGGVRDALVHVVDVLPTVAALVGVEAPGALDGVDLSSLLADPGAEPPRTTLYSDGFEPLGPGPYTNSDLRAVRDATHKVVRDERTGEVQLYRVPPADLDEGERLDLSALAPADAEAYDRLLGELDAAVADLQYGPR